MTGLVTGITYPRRVAGAVLAVSGLLTLFLATIGVYGVVSYAAAQRRGEIAVRMALGAEPRDIVRLLLRDGVTIACGIRSGSGARLHRDQGDVEQVSCVALARFRHPDADAGASHGDHSVRLLSSGARGRTVRAAERAEAVVETLLRFTRELQVPITRQDLAVGIQRDD
jgi:hypothetical protein